MFTLCGTQKIVKICHFRRGAQDTNRNRHIVADLLTTKPTVIVNLHFVLFRLGTIKRANAGAAAVILVGCFLLLNVLCDRTNNIGVAFHKLTMARCHRDLLPDVSKIMHKMREWLSWIIILPSQSRLLKVLSEKLILLTLKLLTSFFHRALVIQSNQCRMLFHGHLIQQLVLATARASGCKIKTMANEGVDSDLRGVRQFRLKNAVQAVIPIQLHGFTALILKYDLQCIWMFGLIFC
mmetsp:Transcript_38524/g.63141  ORF Transcript_38524/g.63141 Transcript_38524/m.63141 type:complete len:237 (-) Transcript_38524:133-843(-)